MPQQPSWQYSINSPINLLQCLSVQPKWFHNKQVRRTTKWCWPSKKLGKCIGLCDRESELPRPRHDFCEFESHKKITAEKTGKAHILHAKSLFVTKVVVEENIWLSTRRRRFRRASNTTAQFCGQQHSYIADMPHSSLEYSSVCLRMNFHTKN